MVLFFLFVGYVYQNWNDSIGKHNWIYMQGENQTFVQI